MSGLKKMTATIAASKAATVTASWTFWFSTSWLFDNLLYPGVIAVMGPLQGGLIMTALAMIVTWTVMYVAIKSGKDWFGMDVAHKIEHKMMWIVRATKKLSPSGKMWAKKLESIAIFLMLSWLFDSMIAVLFYRHGDKTKSLKKRDIEIFVLSGLISNGYWILRSWGIVIVVKFIWKITTQTLI